jgi:hypothetical protein
VKVLQTCCVRKGEGLQKGADVVLEILQACSVKEAHALSVNEEEKHWEGVVEVSADRKGTTFLEELSTKC